MRQMLQVVHYPSAHIAQPGERERVKDGRDGRREKESEGGRRVKEGEGGKEGQIERGENWCN